VVVAAVVVDVGVVDDGVGSDVDVIKVVVVDIGAVEDSMAVVVDAGAVDVPET
jgi:hypothetical protein